MTSNKQTKRALLLSVLSLVICFSMLIGTTFAWFTDSVESGINSIKAGNLDVELYHTNANVTNKSVSGETKLFCKEDGTSILWEPGAVAFENFTVANLGDLDLQYRLAINFEDVNSVLKGNTRYYLSGALMVGFVSGGVNTDADRSEVIASVDNWLPLSSFAFVEHKSLAAKTQDDTFGLVIYWQPTTNDNNWNVNNGASTSNNKPLEINLGVKLEATQVASESDSIDNTYDEGAQLIALPAAAVDDIEAPTLSVAGLDITLDYALQFTASETAADIVGKPYENWTADFVITFSKDVKQDQIALGGYHDAHGGWMLIPLPYEEVKAGQEVRVLKEALAPILLELDPKELEDLGLLYSLIIDPSIKFNPFKCGVVDIGRCLEDLEKTNPDIRNQVTDVEGFDFSNAVALESGTEIKLELRMYEAVESSDAFFGKETGPSHTIATYTYMVP